MTSNENGWQKILIFKNNKQMYYQTAAWDRKF